MSDAQDRYQTAYNQLSETLASIQADYDRRRATQETAEQNLGAFADQISAAADSLRASFPQPEQAEQQPEEPTPEA
jgi:hypothetical protein